MRGEKTRGPRERGAWLAVTALGGVLALVASGREWAEVTGGDTPGLAEATGSLLVPALAPLAWAALAGVVAVLATKGIGRRLVGALIAVCGAGVAVLSWRATGSGAAREALRADVLTQGTAWPYLAMAGGVVLLAAGVFAAVRGGRWSGMSDKYARQKNAPQKDEKSLWDALDRGEDPTLSS
ncbi:Trp biosynthesis-associated membrane protein [Nonomuraea sp. NPDC050328]|uniref:Trp biosynthesis-associated membrane protein n=1 Tax=Nonomuraea sp. NPDC050328 TaxID=3364361 RepID=UPI0037AD65FC